MKIKKVLANNRKKCFEIQTAKSSFEYPFSRLRLKPTQNDSIEDVFPDEEVGKEAFTYRLSSGSEDTVPMDEVLSYNREPNYLREDLLYRLTLKAQKMLADGKSSRRAIMRRMKTSPTQFYRLLDQTNYHKTIDQMVRLLSALDCSVDLIFPKAA